MMSFTGRTVLVVDVEDWELTCGLPGQTSCGAHRRDAYRNCTDAVLRRLFASGDVDGFELAVNLKDDDPEGPTKQAEQRVIAFFKERTA